ALFYSFQGLVVELSAGRVPTDHVDVCLGFFLLLTVWLLVVFQTKIHIRYLLAGVSFGLAFLSKGPPALLLLPLFIFISLSENNGCSKIKNKVANISMLIISLIIVALPWQYYINRNFPKEAEWEKSYNYQHIFVALEGHAHHIFYYFEKIHIGFGELTWVAILLFVVLFLKKKIPVQGGWAIMLWLFIPLILFTFAATKMPNYIMISAPAIIIIYANVYVWVVNQKVILGYKYFYTTLKLLMLILPIRFAIERIKP